MTTPPNTPAPKWYHSVWFVLLMLFFVMGPLGLPLLWKSPRFAKWAKIALTLVMALYTYWLVALTITIIRSTINQMDQLRLIVP